MSDQIQNQQPRLPVVKLLDADNPNLLHHHHHHHQYETATPTGSSRNPSELCTSENSRNNCTTKYGVAMDTATYGDERPPRLPPRPPRDSLSDDSGRKICVREKAKNIKYQLALNYIHCVVLDFANNLCVRHYRKN